MSKILKIDGKIRKTGGKLIHVDKSNCCCGDLGPCAKCGLPTYTDGITPCIRGCFDTDPEISHSPRMYLDFSVTGNACGRVSFTHLPMDGIGSDGISACPNVFAGRIRDGDNPPLEYLHDPVHPYAIGATGTDCAVCAAVINESSGMELFVAGDESSACDWGLGFSVDCDYTTDGEGNHIYNGLYRVYFDYLFSNGNSGRFTYPFTGVGTYFVTAATVITKSWAIDGAVDLTFVFTRPVNQILFSTSQNYPRTFMFRVYTDEP